MTRLGFRLRYDHIAEIDLYFFFEKNSLSVAKVFENKLDQVVEKYSDLILRLFAFVRATKFRYSSKFFGVRSKCFGKELPSLSMRA